MGEVPQHGGGPQNGLVPKWTGPVMHYGSSSRFHHQEGRSQIQIGSHLGRLGGDSWSTDLIQ